MHRSLRIAFFAASLALLGTGASAQDAVTATCKDGSSWSGAQRGGACRGHGGVQSFVTAVAAPAATSTPMSAPATPVAPAASQAAMPRAGASTMATPAPDGGSGQVWVNTSSKVYHCPGARYYGKTKQGAYMTEAVAKAAGDRAYRGKACS